MLTLITATLNAARFLDRALASAATQPGEIEHILIDGGSADRTIDICRRYPGVNAFVVPGCSIYEAWNLGLEHARGTAVMFLNADDELAPGAVAEVERLFAGHPDAEIIAGNAALIDDDDPEMGRRIIAAVPSGSLDVPLLAMGVPAINAMAFRARVFARYGHFETRYRVAGDRAFLLRLALSPSPPGVTRTDSVLYRYHAHGGSLTLRASLEQRLRIARDHIALSRALLADDNIPASAALWLKHMRRREAAVATLRCVAEGHAGLALEFARGFCPRA
jgi:glycosyltransferase involved in cell wall biosynthesis